MGIAGKVDVIFTDAITLRNNSPTVRLNNVPTLVVSRSSSNSSGKNIDLTNIQCINFICGLIAILQSATLLTNSVYLFVNTGSGGVSISLDNGGTVGGSAVYNLKPGQAVEFQFDGNSLS